jgi:serine/threonine-protein kinase
MVICPACSRANSEFNAFCQVCGTTLAAPEAARSRSSGSISAVLGPGTLFGQYEIQGLIGAGSTGHVYRAWSRLLGHSVALKLLYAELAKDQRAQARIRREAQAASALHHPGIATVYEVGENNGRPYIAMALYEGETLETRFARGPLLVADVTRIGAEIASALGAAHGGGITHRDVKPANIILTVEGGVKLVDFGLAKMVNAGAPTLTRTGAVVGTVRYMAPEQLGGEAIDHRADLWSLGVILYEALAGTPPFADGGAARSIFTSEPALISSLRSDTPKELGELISELLRKDPAARVQSAHEVERRLRTLPFP